MGHGAPTNVDDIPLYLKNIRGGTDSSPEVIQIIRDRYEAIGGSSPLLEITKGQADELEKFINQNGGNFKVYIGMRNWAPYIRDVVKQMLKDGVEKIIALCLAPQYSTWSTKRYLHAFNEALEKNLKGDLPPVQMVGSWANHPSLIDAFVEISTHLSYSAMPSAASNIALSSAVALLMSESYFFITSKAAFSAGISLNCLLTSSIIAIAALPTAPIAIDEI